MYKRKLSVNPRVNLIITHAPDSADDDHAAVANIIALLTQATTRAGSQEASRGLAK